MFFFVLFCCCCCCTRTTTRAASTLQSRCPRPTFCLCHVLACSKPKVRVHAHHVTTVRRGNGSTICSPAMASTVREPRAIWVLPASLTMCVGRPSMAAWPVVTVHQRFSVMGSLTVHAASRRTFCCKSSLDTSIQREDTQLCHHTSNNNNTSKCQGRCTSASHRRA